MTARVAIIADDLTGALDTSTPFVDAGFNVYSMPNNYWPWRYLWPARVASPRRVRLPLAEAVGRLDLVLSKTDADTL